MEKGIQYIVRKAGHGLGRVALVVISLLWSMVHMLITAWLLADGASYGGAFVDALPIYALFALSLYVSIKVSYKTEQIGFQITIWIISLLPFVFGILLLWWLIMDTGFMINPQNAIAQIVRLCFLIAPAVTPVVKAIRGVLFRMRTGVGDMTDSPEDCSSSRRSRKFSFCRWWIFGRFPV